MTVLVLLEGAPSITYFDVDDIIVHEAVLEIVLLKGSISFPINRIVMWEVDVND